MSPVEFTVSFIVGAAAGILSGLGIGGGTLIVLYLTLIAKIPQVQAQGINLIYFLCACVPAAVMHIKEKRADVKMTSALSIVGMVSAAVAAWIVTHNGISIHMIKRIFGVLVICAAVFQIIKSTKKSTAA